MSENLYFLWPKLWRKYGFANYQDFLWMSYPEKHLSNNSMFHHKFTAFK